MHNHNKQASHLIAVKAFRTTPSVIMNDYFFLHKLFSYQQLKFRIDCFYYYMVLNRLSMFQLNLTCLDLLIIFCKTQNYFLSLWPLSITVNLDRSRLIIYSMFSLLHPKYYDLISLLDCVQPFLTFYCKRISPWNQISIQFLQYLLSAVYLSKLTLCIKFRLAKLPQFLISSKIAISTHDNKRKS